MGIIRKVTEDELVGGTQNTDIYPITSIKAVYDEDNEALDGIIKRKGVVNVSTNYNKDHTAEVLTLEQAIAKIPSKDRVLGFQGKYLATDGWHTIIYTGDNITSWSDTTKWINLPDKILRSISKNATFGGIATPTTNPETPDGPVFYIAGETGIYANFSGIEVAEGEAAILQLNNGSWVKAIGLATQRQIVRLDETNNEIKEELVAETVRAKAVEQELNKKTSDIKSEISDAVDDVIAIVDNENNEIVHIDTNGLDAKNIKSNGQDVVTAPKEETSDKEECVSFEDSEGNVFAKIGSTRSFISKLNLVNDDELPNPKKAIVLINFDGINKPTFDFVAPYLSERGIPFTVFSAGNSFSELGSPAEGNPPYWSINDVIYAIQHYGMELGFYTSQPAITFEKTDNYYQQMLQLQVAYKRLQDAGMPKPVSVSYSGGIYTWVNQFILQQCFDIQIARTTDWAVHTPSRSEFNIKCKTLGNNNYANSIISDIDSIIESKNTIAPLTHGLYMPDEYPNAFAADASYNTSKEQMKIAFDYIAEKQNAGLITCMTFSQYVKWLTLPESANEGDIRTTKGLDGKYRTYVYKNNNWNLINK